MKIVIGCARPSAPPTPAPVPSVPPSPEVPSAPPVATRHIAFFDGDDLTQCVDVSLIGEPQDAREALEAAFPGQGIPRPCAETFVHKTALAVCVRAPGALPSGETLSWQITDYRYRDVFESDTDMRSCLEQGGDWRPVARDSREAIRARAERVLAGR